MNDAPGDRYLIALTGNIATGKSTVAAMLAELGATVIDADQIAHQVMQRGNAVYEQVVAIFGAEILGDDREINRQQLGRMVFSDPDALRQLEEMVHPAVGLEVQRQILATQTPVVVVEAIKLIEAGWHHACNALWVTDCSRELQIARLVQIRGLDIEAAQQRVDAQPPQAEKRRLADVVIDTSGNLEETRRQVHANWSEIWR